MGTKKSTPSPKKPSGQRGSADMMTFLKSGGQPPKKKEK